PMSKSPEKYCLDEEISPEEHAEEMAFSDTERGFLDKYLGSARSILDSSGIEEAEPQALDMAEVEPPQRRTSRRWRKRSASMRRLPRFRPSMRKYRIRPRRWVRNPMQSSLKKRPGSRPLSRRSRPRTLWTTRDAPSPRSRSSASVLEDQEFTIPINAVQEVARSMVPTAVPESHGYLAAIVIPRGRVTPGPRLCVNLG
ncbi:hypothetical protein DQK91_22405, partial [Oceanidesulfovibrio marinus]